MAQSIPSKRSARQGAYRQEYVVFLRSAGDL
jgi:hypothetical protein